ncbi:MAG TPA: sigma-70 family RNA polymerase sigma factor [Feifaniaceae bacterium]|nr:sigma-70 family RNA polymerase sigma factor [Feifaniaceae bacterium]
MEQNWLPGEREIARLVETYSDMLLRVALNRTQNLAEAEDIVQSVYLRLLRARPRFTSAAHEKAWLLRTAVNLCKDYQKSAARRMSVPLEEETAVSLPPETREVLDIVARLPESDRYAVYLYYYERMPVGEIARALGEKEGTVSSRLSRARKKLKTLLKGEGYESL